MKNLYKKIKPLNKLVKEIKELKARGKTVVQCHGVFDLIHPGHIRHLASAKKEGDILVVTITADKYVRKGPGRPIFNENLRAETLAAMSMVDYVAINHAPTATNCIRLLQPDVYVKGRDYIDRDKDVTGKIREEEKAIASVGGRVVLTHDITFSSSKLINEYLQVFPEQTRSYLKGISSKYSLDRIFGVLDSIQTLKILVIGEAIIDQYHYCLGTDKSRKSNVLAYRYISEESFAGGSLAIVNHLSGLTKKVSLITIMGNDAVDFKRFLKKAVSPSVNMISFSREDASTIVKRRFVSEGEKVFEICYLNDSPISPDLTRQINQKLKRIIRDYDLVIVSDFGHGFLVKDIIRTVCKQSKFLAVNTQTNGANMGFNYITQYSKVDYANLDELELRYAAHDKFSSINKIIKDIVGKIGCENLIITRGYNGALGFNKKTRLLIEGPALATSVIDPIGAGDAFFAFTAPLVAKGIPQDLVIFIGNAVGALAVQIVCNRQPVDPVDLKKFITTILK